LAAHTEVTVELGTDRFQARAGVAAEPERTRLFDERIAEMPRFGDYQNQTERNRLKRRTLPASGLIVTVEAMTE